MNIRTIQKKKFGSLKTRSESNKLVTLKEFALHKTKGKSGNTLGV